MTFLQEAIAGGMFLAGSFIVVLVIAVIVAVVYLTSGNSKKSPEQTAVNLEQGQPVEPERRRSALEGCATFFIIIAIVILVFVIIAGMATCNVEYD